MQKGQLATNNANIETVQQLCRTRLWLIHTHGKRSKSELLEYFEYSAQHFVNKDCLID